MPDKWEYPWYAAWDLAFHCLPLALVDAEFAKRQLLLMTREWYMHPNGQLPAYEWAFGDVNPPVHAWATWRVFQIDRKQRGDAGDIRFLERVFHKLLINFTWWVNRKDVDGNNVFQGGFLGLDNIGVFDRSAPLPTGGHIDQSDGTAWMAMYSLNLMRIALELAQHNDDLRGHRLEVLRALPAHRRGDDERRRAAACGTRRTRSTTTGSTCPASASDAAARAQHGRPDPAVRRRGARGRAARSPARLPQAAGMVPQPAPGPLRSGLALGERRGVGQRRLLSLLRGRRMKALLRRMLDESEFLSPYGVRALSRVHLEHPFRFEHGGQEFIVRYTPGESDTHAVRRQLQLARADLDAGELPPDRVAAEVPPLLRRRLQGRVPDRLGRMVTLLEAAEEIVAPAARGCSCATSAAAARRFGDDAKLQNDPHFRDYVLFYEYFHGDTGRGVGASHQTGWTGLVAKLIQPRRGS